MVRQVVLIVCLFNRPYLFLGFFGPLPQPPLPRRRYLGFVCPPPPGYCNTLIALCPLAMFKLLSGPEQWRLGRRRSTAPQYLILCFPLFSQHLPLFSLIHVYTGERRVHSFSFT